MLFNYIQQLKEEQQTLDKMQSELQDDKDLLNEVRMMYEERIANEWIDEELKVIERLQREGVVNTND